MRIPRIKAMLKSQLHALPIKIRTNAMKIASEVMLYFTNVHSAVIKGIPKHVTTTL